MSALASFRQSTPALRVCAAWTARGLGQTTRLIGVGLLFAGFVGASGAFGVGRISLDVRLPILALAAAGVALGQVAIRAALGRMRWGHARGRLALESAAGAIWATLFCWTLARLFEGAAGTPPAWAFLPPILIAYATTAALILLFRSAAPAPADRPGPPPFLQRLPHRLRSATLIAVQGEDHYVRVHTSLGQHLMLMRLADALTELRGAAGGQTHRSWWVARAAVTAVRRANGRAVLSLSNGAEAPVSRRFSPWLRQNGWY